LNFLHCAANSSEGVKKTMPSLSNRVKLSSFLFLGIACSLILFGGVATLAASGNAGDYFYYSDGEKIPLRLSPSRIAVFFKPQTWDSAKQRLNYIIHFPEQMSEGKLILAHLKPSINVSQALNELQRDSSVEQVLPVYEAAGADMVVTDEFIAEFKDNVSLDAINTINAFYGVKIVKKANFGKNTYILKISPEKTLATANAYHELEEVVYAHPNFIRFMTRSVENPFPKRNRVIWGPKNEILPEDYEIPKGSVGYRTMERAAMIYDGPPLSSSVTGPMTPVTRNVLLNANFESGMPSSLTLYGYPTWGVTSYRAYAGTWSAYCVGNPVSAPGPYPDNVSSWMVFGPFSLTDAQDARISVKAWCKTENNYDFFWIMSSTDGYNFSGIKMSGDWTTGDTFTPWRNFAVSFSDLGNISFGNLLGQSQVWIALIFTSDSSLEYEGAYVDNLRVEKITSGYASSTNDPYQKYQWSISNNEQRWGTESFDLKINQAWPISMGNQSIKVAFIDEGVDIVHPDLLNNLISGYDATGQGSAGAPSGDDAHGTNCAGIVAAVANNSKGVAGLAPLCKIMPVRIAYSDTNGNWVTTDAWIADAFTWAVDHGADVLNNSWGGGSSSTAINNAITYAKTSGRQGKGCVVTFSAGNDNGPISYPANLSNVLAVGAISPAGEKKAPISDDGEFWWGSNYGPQLALVAPGTLIYSTDIHGSHGYTTTDYFPNFNGTSGACPHVSGVAALVLSINPKLTAAQVESILKTTATPLGGGFNNLTGYGLVNAYQAVHSVPSAKKKFIPFLLLLLE
jgi:subtilisin family serine protease